MAKQGRGPKRYVLIDSSIAMMLTHSQSPAKKKHLQRKKRKNRSSSSDRNSFPSASTVLGSPPFIRTNPQAGEHAPQSLSGTRWLRIRKRLSRRRNKRLRNDGNKAITWSRTRSSVNFWKVRITNPLYLCLFTQRAKPDRRGEGS